MSATQPAADGTAVAAPAVPAPISIPALEAEIRPVASAWPRPSTSSPTG